jgi:hypothetical protein
MTKAITILLLVTAACSGMDRDLAGLVGQETPAECLHGHWLALRAPDGTCAALSEHDGVRISYVTGGGQYDLSCPVALGCAIIGADRRSSVVLWGSEEDVNDAADLAEGTIVGLGDGGACPLSCD